ncbi:hypothetical protein IJ098_02960 [Candidatus Saccharibacteria bacterium]|nr:hypothetical protein [Candidatus Saccharibacteria bacterium]
MEDNLADAEMPDYLDNKKIEENLKHGFLALTAITDFVESFLNTVLRDCINSKESRGKLKESITGKIDYICGYYNIQKGAIKGGQKFAMFRKANNIRDELIHYKINWSSEGIGIMDFNIPENETFKNYFTRSSFEKVFESAIGLCNDITCEAGLYINKSASIIECAARDGLTSYVFDKDKINVDPSRGI